MYRIEDDLERDPSVVRRTGKQIFYAPLYWSQPQFILTCSMSDWFHSAADKWRDEAWEIIRQTPEHVYRILTKRPELIRERDTNGNVIKDRLPENWDNDYDTTWKHVHLGVTVESQQYAEGTLHPVKGWIEGRMSILRKVPCTLRWVSCEPLLGPVKLNLDGYSWLVAGGESDRDTPRPPASPGSPAVFLDLQQQTAQAHIPLLFLALGGSKPCHCCKSRWGCRRINGRLSQQFPFPTLVAQGQLSENDKERKIKKAKLLRVLSMNGVKKFGDTTQYCINWEIYKQTNSELYKILLTEPVSNSTLDQLQTQLPGMKLQLETWPERLPITPTPAILQTTPHKPR